MPSVTVSGAYGRDYKASFDALQDWKDGKDFFLHCIDGKPSRVSYCSIRDFDPEDEIHIRYDKLERMLIL
jgi:hypothetical protein